MVSFGLLAVVLAGLIAIVFILVFGTTKAMYQTWVGSLHHLLMSALPNALGYMLRSIIGYRGMAYLDRQLKWLNNDKHPLGQIFYLFLVVGGLIEFVLQTVPRIHQKMEWWIVVPITTWTYAAFYLASTSDPGYINRDNVDKACTIFDYDYWIFTPRKCTTCDITKPARSKHCSVCKGCIARSESGTLSRSKRKPDCQDAVFSTDAWILAVVVFAFFLYQATFAVYGITTNESFKWGDAAYAIKTGYIEHIPKSVFDYNRDYRRLKLRAMASGLQSPAEKLLRKRTRAVANEMLLEESVGSGGMETTQSTSTLLSPDVVCQSKSEDAGNEGAPIAYYRASTHGKRMSNIYNLGLWRNIMDVVFPKPF
ncbi:hypothetical protein BASA61_001714 [Batrachochytrium salamandrivorans]|nr:hypothetical protein BASA61_001714 [Batrachochytrium salamandrivorans]